MQQKDNDLSLVRRHKWFNCVTAAAQVKIEERTT